MHKSKIFLAISFLVLASLACSINFDNSVTTDIMTGPVVTDQISIPPLQDSNEIAQVKIHFGAGELNLTSGAVNALVSGEATYNIDDLKPDISIDNEKIKIQTGSIELNGIPRITDKVKNIWDLKFASTPIDLTIKAGAYVGDFELGGLSLNNLNVADGAAEVNLNFATPNQVEMGSFRYETGASNIKLTNLSNANFDTMIFQSGAGNYELDFSGQLLRDASVFIETGLSTMTISVPDNMNVEVRVEGGLTNVTTRGSWDQLNDTYIISGEGPMLTIVVEINAGNLILRNS